MTILLRLERCQAKFGAQCVGSVDVKLLLAAAARTTATAAAATAQLALFRLLVTISLTSAVSAKAVAIVTAPPLALPTALALPPPLLLNLAPNLSLLPLALRLRSAAWQHNTTQHKSDGSRVVRLLI